MPVKPIRDGFRTITPYLLVSGVDHLIAFLQKAFDAKVLSKKARPGGGVMHAELKIGDSMVMMGEPNETFGPMPTHIYLYVEDCDSVYAKAIKAGGVSVMELTNMFSGERYGGVKDPSGNIWWVATHIEDVSSEEEARRMAAFFKSDK